MQGDSIESLQGLRITSLDSDDDDNDVCEDQGIIVREDDDDDTEEDEEEPVTLGFLEKPKKHWSLLRQLFPSKAGGVPAWLDPINLPSESSSACGICGEPLQFLLQVYAPISENESAFHRALLVFMCPSMSCLLQDQHEQWKRGPEKQTRSVKVFRCQLPRSNSFYSSEPPRSDGTDEPSGAGAPLCNWCGTWKGGKLCGGCKKVRYCSHKHQVLHWGSGHKIDCQRLILSAQFSDSSYSNAGTSALNRAASKSLWPEYEMVIEDESEFDFELSEDDRQEGALISRNGEENSVKSVFNRFEGNIKTRHWAAFQERLGKAPQQVLRYCRNTHAKPLWPLLSGQPSNADIPKCSYCGGTMDFEFQILPQLLYFFGVKNEVDSLDWATVAGYTCRDSCDGSIAYKEEFAWVQLYS